MSLQDTSAIYCHKLSEIEGLQKAETIFYYFYPRSNGVTLTVAAESDSGKKSESCLCPTLSASSAQNLLKFAYENSIGPGAWSELLNDCEIPFQLVSGM